MKPKDARCKHCKLRSYTGDHYGYYCDSSKHPDGSQSFGGEPCTRDDYKDCEYKEAK